MQKFCFHLDYFLLFLRSPLLTLRMYLFAGKGMEQQLLLSESLKYLTQQKNTYSKLATETLKQDVKSVNKNVNSRDCVSLLTTCNLSKTFVKCFSGYSGHIFVYCDAFIFTSLLAVLNRFHALIGVRHVFTRLLTWFKINNSRILHY